MRVLVTGVAGFIGMHVAERLLARGDEVLGVDNLNDYYDPALKAARLARLTPHPAFSFLRMDLADREGTAQLFRDGRPDAVVHLAAQAGVRYSLQNPAAYIDANLVGFANVLEGCRHHPVRHLVYASSSSVYGANSKLPFAIEDPVDGPVSLYAATKKANELMGHCYAHLYRIPATGLRFFTVYGPWGRPDMAYFSFTEAILRGAPIAVFNEGRLQRDFTYIDDIIEALVRVLDQPPPSDAGQVPHRLYNIGNSAPVALMTFIETLENLLGIPAQKEMRPMQAGDVPATYADVRALEEAVGFRPRTSLREGLARFVTWYRGYHGV
jgi:UDP-glucuronate 4-epimerase